MGKRSFSLLRNKKINKSRTQAEPLTGGSQEIVMRQEMNEEITSPSISSYLACS